MRQDKIEVWRDHSNAPVETTLTEFDIPFTRLAHGQDLRSHRWIVQTSDGEKRFTLFQGQAYCAGLRQGYVEAQYSLDDYSPRQVALAVGHLLQGNDVWVRSGYLR